MRAIQPSSVEGPARFLPFQVLFHISKDWEIPGWDSSLSPISREFNTCILLIKLSFWQKK